MTSVFNKLNNINVNEHTEKKGTLTYLSWAWAWAKIKENYPNAYYTIYENEYQDVKEGVLVTNKLNYFTDGKTAFVKTGVTIEDIEHIEYLPVMNHRNKSITLEELTSFEVNTAIQRSLTKACARHGLGLYIYAGEDLPQEDDEALAKALVKMNKLSKDLASVGVDVHDQTFIDYVDKLVGLVDHRNIEKKNKDVEKINKVYEQIIKSKKEKPSIKGVPDDEKVKF